MNTDRRSLSARRRIALHLGRLLVLSSMVSVVVLTQSDAASASTTNFAPRVDYETGNHPVSVVVGDFNGDGDPDVATAGSTVSVNLGGPGGSFGPVSNYEGGYELRSIAIGDFDADDHPDLVVADELADTVSVLLGSPDGTFGDPTSFPVDVTPTAVAVGDFDGDDDPDLAVSSVVNDTLSILLGGPGGTFGPKTSIQAGFSSPLSVAVGDFNGDSDPDLAVGDVPGNVHVLLGGPAATFGPATVYSTGAVQDVGSMKIALGDFNDDSDPDIVVVDKGRGVWTLLGESGGGFTAPRGYVVPHTTDVAVGDFNDDSRADLAISEDAGQLEVLHGRGDGTFVNLTQFPTGGSSTAVAAGDFDADGRTDVVLTNPQGGGRKAGIAVLLNPSDTTPPNTTITAGPNGAINDETPTFTFTSSEAGSTFECRVDDADFSACSSPHTSAALTEGAHTFEVRANDRSGNVDPTPEYRAFTVDTVAPDTTITGGPDGPTSDDTPTFTFESSEPGATFECGIGGFFATCTSPYTTGDLGGADFTFQVRARDAAGNVDATPASRSFTIDQTPPSTSITSGPSGVTGDSTPTFGFTSPESGATFECRVDDAAFEACTTPHTTAELTDGAHVFYVRAIDPVGNVDPVPAGSAFTVDTVAPDTTIGSGPTGVINDTTPIFGWEYSAGVLAHECRVDDEPFAPCESPETTGPLSDGQHTFELRAIDAAGNIDPTPASRTFTVDTEALTTGITAGPSGLTNDPAPTFTFATSESGSTFECKVSGDFEPCTSPYTSAHLTDGEHTFEVRSTDPAGNVEAPPVGRTFTVDTTAPDTTITSGPTGTTDDQTPTFGFSSPEAGATLECRVDDAAFGPCTSPYTTALLANGDHTFEARATDAAGNSDPTPASRTFTVKLDITPPQTQIDSGPADLTNHVNAVFTFSADEPATFECKVDAGAYASCDSGDTFGPLDAGNHTFAVRATDAAGNADPVPATWNWIVDTTPPQTTITSAPTLLSLLSSKATFAFSSSEGGSLFECRLDGGAWAACTSPRIYTGVRPGNHTFSVRAIDPAGNTDPTPAEATWSTFGLLPF